MMNESQEKTLSQLQEKLSELLNDSDYQKCSELIDRMYGETDQAVLVNELQYFAQRIKGLLATYNPVELFPEQLSNTKSGPGKIINVNLSFSFQSHDDYTSPALAIESIDIGGKHYVKHAGSEWKEEHYGRD